MHPFTGYVVCFGLFALAAGLRRPVCAEMQAAHAEISRHGNLRPLHPMEATITELYRQRSTRRERSLTCELASAGFAAPVRGRMTGLEPRVFRFPWCYIRHIEACSFSLLSIFFGIPGTSWMQGLSNAFLTLFGFFSRESPARVVFSPQRHSYTPLRPWAVQSPSKN